MSAKFASCALVLLSLLLCGVSGQRWTVTATSINPGTYPANNGGTGNPGSRYSPALWKDASGNVWIFGGTGYGSDSSAEGELSDMWVYSGNFASWNFWGGSKTVNTAPTGSPSPRVNAASWVDSTGTNLYLYGGYYTSSNNYLAELWVFNTGTHAWTQLSTTAPNSLGSFPAASGGIGLPPGTAGQCSWTDSGNLYMFAGTSRQGDYNDLWKYTPGSSPTTLGTWTWLNGAKTGGTTQSTSTQPGSRSGGLEFYAASGVLWLYGGISALNTAPSAYGDLWKYTIATNTWAYVAGSQTLNYAGVYNGIGATGTPKARGYAASWTDTQGGFWLFGGVTQASALTDDLWKYSVSANTFTLVTGSTSANQKDTYQGANANPGSRSSVASWVDNIGQLSMLFGTGFGAAPSAAALNQIATYNGAPLLTTSSVSTSSTSSATLAATSSSSATTAATNLASTSSASSLAASNLATTSASSTLAASSSSSVSSTSTTTALVSSSTSSAQGVATGSVATSSSTVAATTSTLAASSSSSNVVATTNSAVNSQQTTLSASTVSTATTFAASSTSSVSTSITTGGSTVSTQTASTSATASTSGTVSASTNKAATSSASTSATSVAATALAASSSSSNSLSVATATSSSTSQSSQTTSFASLSSTLAASTSSISTSSTTDSVSTTSKATTIAQAVSSSSSASTTANTHVTSVVTVTTTVATTATRASSSTSTLSTTSSSSKLSTSTSTTAVAGAQSLTPIYALATAIAFGVFLL